MSFRTNISEDTGSWEVLWSLMQNPSLSSTWNWLLSRYCECIKEKTTTSSNSHIPDWKLSSATKNIILDLLFCGACYAISGRAIIYQYDGAVRIALIHIRQQRSKTKGKKERYWGYLNFKMLGFYWQGPHGELQKDHRHSRLRNKQLLCPNKIKSISLMKQNLFWRTNVENSLFSSNR